MNRSEIETALRELGYTVENGTARPTARNEEIIGKMGTNVPDFPKRDIGKADQEQLDIEQLGYMILGIPVTANGYKDVPRFIRCRVKNYVDAQNQGTWEFDGTPRDYTDVPLSEFIDETVTKKDLEDLTAAIDRHRVDGPDGYRYDPTKNIVNVVKMKWPLPTDIPDLPQADLKKADIECRKIPNNPTLPVTTVRLFVQLLDGYDIAFREMA